MRRFLSLYSFLFIILLTFANQAFSDSRLIGRWTIVSTSVSLPPGVALDIRQNGSNFQGFSSISAIVPAPINCPIKTTDAIVTIAPNGETNRFVIKFNSYIPTTCSLTPIIDSDVTVTFSADNNNFTSCTDSGLCISWTKFPSTISKTTIPLPVIAYAGKGSISVSWNYIAGAYAYRVKIKGPTFLQRTVKKGSFTKFTGLSKGSYKVSYIGFFKDALGKIATTKTSVTAKVTVK